MANGATWEITSSFTSDTGAILNWWQSTSAITFQGPGLAAEEFEAKLFDAFGDGREIIPPKLLGGITADKSIGSVLL